MWRQHGSSNHVPLGRNGLNCPREQLPLWNNFFKEKGTKWPQGAISLRNKFLNV